MELLRADSLLDLVAKPGGGATALPLVDSMETSTIMVRLEYQCMM